MKQLIKYIPAVLFALCLMSSCDDFGDVNKDPEHFDPDNMDYKLMFTQVESQIAGSDWDVWRNACIYATNMMQHITSTNWSHGVFYTWTEVYNTSYWDAFYSGNRGAIRNITEVMSVWKESEKHYNEYQYCRVMRAYMLQRMTDLYGDVPYSEAGYMFAGIYNPKYDTQQTIYADLLKEMDEVNTALKNSTANNEIKSADVIYNGDPEMWRKCANSLMLRMAMRLIKVAPEDAKTWAAKAVANGLFESAADNAMLPHADGVVTDDSAEPYGKVFSQLDTQAFYVSEYFIDNLKSTNDPRIHLIATRTTDSEKSWSSGSFDYGDSSDADQLIGLPIGYDNSDTQWGLANAPGYPGKDWRNYYALPNRMTYARPDVPSMLVTYAENNLLLAEAAYRGFISGSAEDYFKKGVKAAMEQFSFYSPAKTIYETFLPSSAIDAYVNSRLSAFGENALKEINWQYYVTTFCDEYETFANWRRSGYPELKSVYEPPFNRPKYPTSVTDGIPRRFTYPTSEAQNNAANYRAGVATLDKGDTMESRVWWDKE